MPRDDEAELRTFICTIQFFVQSYSQVSPGHLRGRLSFLTDMCRQLGILMVFSVADAGLHWRMVGEVALV